MFSRLFLLFVVVPALELYLLIKIGQWIGAAETFLLILVTGLIGSAMAKAEGLAVWGRFNRRMAKGKVPGKELLDGIIILVSGAFLITPGVLTDVVGLLGLFPPTRALIRGVLMERISRKGISSARSVFFHFSSSGGSGDSGPSGPGSTAGTGAASTDRRRSEFGRESSETASSNGSTQVSGRAKERPSHGTQSTDPDTDR